MIYNTVKMPLIQSQALHQLTMTLDLEAVVAEDGRYAMGRIREDLDAKVGACTDMADLSDESIEEIVFFDAFARSYDLCVRSPDVLKSYYALRNLPGMEALAHLGALVGHAMRELARKERRQCVAA